MKIKKNHKLDPEQLFTDVEKMLYKMAWDAARTHGLDYNDCLSECYYAFVKAVNWRFDPNRGVKFSSLVGTIARWRLRTLALERNQAVPMLELDEQVAGYAPPQQSACLEVVEGLSQDAREIINLLLDTPAELMEEVSTAKQLLGVVKRFLITQGRDKKDLRRAQAEIESAFREVWATA